MSATFDHEAPLTPAIAREAAQWLIRFSSGEASEADRHACLAWRNSHPDHERAWQRAERVSQTLGLIPSAIGMPTLERPASRDRRAVLKMLPLLIVTGSAAAVSYRLAPWREWAADARTATGEIRTLTLADGTRLTLNTASAADIVFNDVQRTVRLRAGEIHVETAPDPVPLHRPFVVQTADGTLTALGTRFTVRLEGDWLRSRTHVAVSEGAVEIRPLAAAAHVLPAGSQAVFETHAAPLVAPLALRADGWVEGILYADEMPLGELAEQLARYRPGVLRCDPAVAGLRVSGAFHLKATDKILQLLQSSLPVQIEYRTRYWVSIGPA